MLIIAHRSNLDGQNPALENNPYQIEKVLKLGFDIEIDVWYSDHAFYLGHDYPLYHISERFLENEKLWCHAKNIEAFEKMLFNEKIHCFWHQKDSFTITSKNIIWCFPGQNTSLNYPSIIVLPEQSGQLIDDKTFGICTDYPIIYK